MACWFDLKFCNLWQERCCLNSEPYTSKSWWSAILQFHRCSCFWNSDLKEPDHYLEVDQTLPMLLKTLSRYQNWMVKYTSDLEQKYKISVWKQSEGCMLIPAEQLCGFLLATSAAVDVLLHFQRDCYFFLFVNFISFCEH